MTEALVHALAVGWPYMAIVLCIVVCAFFSGSETGAYRVNRVRLRLAQQHGRSSARRLAGLLADMPGLICVTLIGTNLAAYIATTLMTHLWTNGAGHEHLYSELLASLTLAPILFVFAEAVPKDIFNREADRLMYPAARPLWLASLVFRALGLIAVLKAVSAVGSRVSRHIGEKRTREDMVPFPARARLQSILRDSAAEGALTPYQSELAEKIMSLRDVHIAAVMVPAASVVAIALDASLERFRDVVSSCAFSRLPVLDPASGDVIGFIRIHDVLLHLHPEAEFDLTRYVRLPLDLADATNVAQAIFAMQNARLPLSIVRDGRGKFVGIATLKDLAGEIVGEIEGW